MLHDLVMQVYATIPAPHDIERWKIVYSNVALLIRLYLMGALGVVIVNEFVRIISPTNCVIPVAFSLVLLVAVCATPVTNAYVQFALKQRTQQYTSSIPEPDLELQKVVVQDAERYSPPTPPECLDEHRIIRKSRYD